MRKVIMVGVFGATLGVSASLEAVEVCAYRVTATIGSPCPVSRGSQICLSESAAIGPCDSALHCVGGPGYFCQAEVEPVRGPQRACPFGTLRPRGFRCHKPLTPGPGVTATATPIGSETPTHTPTPTGIPTGTASATATGTATPSLTATAAPTSTATAAPTFTATAIATSTATGVPTGTASATVTSTATPSLTATAAATSTATATGVPTGTAATLVGGRIARQPSWR